MAITFAPRAAASVWAADSLRAARRKLGTRTAGKLRIVGVSEAGTRDTVWSAGLVTVLASVAISAGQVLSTSDAFHFT